MEIDKRTILVDGKDVSLKDYKLSVAKVYIPFGMAVGLIAGLTVPFAKPSLKTALIGIAIGGTFSLFMLGKRFDKIDKISNG